MFCQSTYYPVHILSLQSRVQSILYDIPSPTSFTCKLRAWRCFCFFPFPFCALMVEINRSIQKACFHFQWIWNSSIFLVNHCKFLTNAGSLNFLSQTAKSDFDKFNIQYICHAWTDSIPRNTSRDIRLFWQNLNVWKRSLYVFYPSQYFLEFIFVISYFASPRADSAGL